MALLLYLFTTGRLTAKRGGGAILPSDVEKKRTRTCLVSKRGKKQKRRSREFLGTEKRPSNEKSESL